MNEQEATTGSRNFTLRLSADDQARLETLAARLKRDRTSVLRLLIRRAVPCLTLGTPAAFSPVSRSQAASKVLPIDLRLKGGRR